MGQLLAIGTELKVKVRLPLFKTGYCADPRFVRSRRGDEGVKLGAAFIEHRRRDAERDPRGAADLAPAPSAASQSNRPARLGSCEPRRRSC